MNRLKYSAALFALFFLTAAPAHSQDDEMDVSSGASFKARQAHDLAASDVIYQQEEWKALYYQNLQIIQLLTEIRNTLEGIKAQASAPEKEKTG